MGAGIGSGWHSVEMLVMYLNRQTQAGVSAVSNIAEQTSPASTSFLETLSTTDLSLGLENPTLALLSLSLLILSLFAKEALYHATLRIARKTKSDVLHANAYHHRADAASSLVALAGVGGAYMGFPILDPIGGLLVSGMIAQASLGLFLPALRELSDSSPVSMVKRVETVIAKMQDRESNIKGFHTVRVRKMGPDYLADLKLVVNERVSVSTGCQLAENVRHALLTGLPELTEVLIHLTPNTPSEIPLVDLPPSPTPLPTQNLEVLLSTLALTGLEGVAKVSHLKVFYLEGNQVDVELEILLKDENMTFKQAVEVAKKVKGRLQGVDGVRGVDVHLETEEHDESEHEEVSKLEKERVGEQRSWII
ncbi:hypothetical protein HDV05_000247 [Chytridiales sp. JEL 0842]|nr:hypothetical protein HDV05_000247 [Chytridiales sp. JEL 0842]